MAARLPSIQTVGGATIEALPVILVDGNGNAAGAGTPSNPSSVVSANPATIASRKAAVTTAPTPLAALGFVNGSVYKSGSSTYGDTNTSVVWVGGSDMTNTGGTIANGYPLGSGEAISYAVTNASAIYVCTATGLGTLYGTGN